MAKVPCRKCDKCGTYHDVSVTNCDCGADISEIPAFMMETEEIEFEVFGDINTEVEFYVQKCPVCGALNFTSGKDKKVKRCHNCTKVRIASVEPMEYKEETEEAKTENQVQEEPAQAPNTYVANTNTYETNKVTTPFDDDDDDDDDDGPSEWAGLLGTIQKTVAPNKPTPKPAQPVQQPTHPVQQTEVDDDDDDDDDADWGGIFGSTAPKPKTVTPTSKKNITLTAMRYGNMSFTVTPDASPYLLGRSANQSAFLAYDTRVGNQHCYLTYKDGTWYVQDNHSSNGTAVDSRDIGLNGERALADGCALKLGHHPDSMEFRVSIQ